MSSFAKANAILRDMSDKLAKRLANSSTINTVAQSQDANGWPMIICSHNATLTAGNPVVEIRVQSVDAVSKDIFGNSMKAYAPHTLEIAYELDANGKPTPAASDIMTISFEAIKTGIKIQLKEIAHATAVTATAMDAASPVAEIEELYWPTKGV